MVDISPFSSDAESPRPNEEMDASFSTVSDNDGGQQTKEKKKADEALAKAETRMVRILRVMVMLVLVGTAVLVSALAYFYIKNDEDAAFASNFYGLGDRLIQGFHTNARKSLQAIDGFATDMASIAKMTGQTWPNVTIPDFEAKATHARSIAGSFLLGLYPLIPNETRKEWVAYTTENLWWLEESYDFQKSFTAEHNRKVGDYSAHRQRNRILQESVGSVSSNSNRNNSSWPDDQTVWQYDGFNLTKPPVNLTYGPLGNPLALYEYGGDVLDELGYTWIEKPQDGPFAPMWQFSPARENAIFDINFDLYTSTYPEEFEIITTRKSAVFAKVWNVDEGVIAEDDDFDLRMAPVASVLYPVFDQVQYDLRGEVVAFIEYDFEFGPLLASVLPADSHALICVISNPCDDNGNYSYIVTGGAFQYLGAGDFHDPTYDDMMVEASLAAFDQVADGDGSYYNGVPLEKDWCPYNIKVYATQEMEESYVTDKPYFVAAAIFGVSLFTILVFILYDFAVKSLHTSVSKRAKTSDAIVQSLFPEQVAKQLYEEREDRSKKLKEQHQTRGPGAENDDAFGSLEMTMAKKTAIASHYDSVTILFADLAGFTKWSSGRSPEDVFTMLETLYGAFDRVAKRRKVFKIETIGDCYVAVCGLPTPNPNHAVVMTKFAKECMEAMDNLKNGDLANAVGDDVRELQFRVGMHSGGVIAGVLRGEKGRFQLFGDTMNTASRMESNGFPGRIHVSQETADALRAKGKEAWLTPREDKIVAKGKGELQTFWVQITSAGSTMSGASSRTPPFPISSSLARKKQSLNMVQV